LKRWFDIFTDLQRWGYTMPQGATWGNTGVDLEAEGEKKIMGCSRYLWFPQEGVDKAG
jgi:hypothetical protein